jgi:hypothetical protein
VPVIAATVLFAAIGCCGGGIWAIVMVIRSTDIHEMAMERVRADKRVIETLGEPIEEGFYVMGNVQYETDGGSADLQIPIHGPKAKATAYVVATRAGGVWTIHRLYVELGDSELIVIIDESGPLGPRGGF